MNTNEFIEEYKKVFPNRKRSFEKTEYVNSKTKVTVTCHEVDEDGNEHGDFEKVPYSHLSGIDCPKCSHMSYAYTTDEFKKKVEKLYNGLYEVENGFEYKNQSSIVPLYCKKHGISFKKKAKIILRGVVNCPQCGKEKILNALRIPEEEFFKRIEEENNGRYDTSKVKYCSVDDKIDLICHEKDENGEEHGEFHPTFSNFTKAHSGCPKCALIEQGENRRIPFETWIEKFKEAHGNRYDLSLILEQGVIPSRDSDIYPICHAKDEFGREHGKFKTSPRNFASGTNCPKCNNRGEVDEETWLLRCNKMHGNKYRYLHFVDIYSDAIIACPIHGVFTKHAGRHMRGVGCPKCNESRLERDVRILLDENKIKYESYMKADFLKSKRGGFKSLDFYLPEYKIAIECQGKQHFGFGGWLNEKESVEQIAERDIEKKEQCTANGILLIYYLDREYKNYVREGDIFFTDKEELINFIKSNPIVENNAEEVHD